MLSPFALQGRRERRVLQPTLDELRLAPDELAGLPVRAAADQCLDERAVFGGQRRVTNVIVLVLGVTSLVLVFGELVLVLKGFVCDRPGGPLATGPGLVRPGVVGPLSFARSVGL